MRGKTDPKEYLLRGIPPELFTQIKHFCYDEGITIKEFMLNAIMVYMQHHTEKSEE